MRHTMIGSMFRWLATAGLALGCLVAAAGPGLAVERAEDFLQGLREHGYFDMAIEYLEQMRTSPLCPPELKEAIDYEAAVTLMAGSLAIQDPKLREKDLDQARDKFEAFIKADPRHPLVPGARMQLANVLVARGQSKMEQAGRSTKSAEERKQLMSEARALHQEARKVFTEAERHFTAEHKKFPKVIPPKDTKKIEAREQVRKDLVQSRLLLATVAYEIAKTHPADSKEFKAEMTGAAKQYHDLYAKYKMVLAGLYARMWEGRCYKELGDKESLKTAQVVFEEMLLQPDEPKAYRDMKNKSLILLLETYNLPALKKYAETLKKGKEWEDAARGPEENSPDGLAVHFQEGEAAMAILRGMKKDDKDYGAMRKEARRHFDFVGRFDGRYQQQARARMRDPLLGGEKLPEPTNFSEARDRGKAALDEMQAADFELKLKQSQGPVDAKTVKEFQQRMDAARDEAKVYFRKALELGVDEIPSKELNTELNIVRYYLAYLYWATDELYEAAVMGEFLARKYPNAAGARPGAKIAMAAYAKLRSEIPQDGDRSFETDMMVRIAEHITQRWSGGPEAEEAWLMLIRTAIVDRDVKKAKEYLEKLPADSARRSEAQLLVGQALWTAYVRSSYLPEDERPAQAQLTAMIQEARGQLEGGIAKMRKAEGELSYTLLSAALSLAQIYIETNEPKKAIAILEEPKIGPLALEVAGNPVTDRGNFRVETYKAALRAYVADQQLDKAEKTMDALEKLMGAGGDAEAGKKLTDIYISLGLELERQVKRLQKENNPAALQNVLNGFELFLTRISKRPGNSFNSLHWVAETFYSLGSGLDPGTSQLPKNVRQYYEKARDTFQKILDEIEAGQLEAPEGADTRIKIRLARCLRRLREYQESMNLLLDILQRRNMMVNAQVEAAYTYQAWATAPDKAGYYLKAIMGGAEAKRKKDDATVRLVWGWGKLAKLVMRIPAHRNVFHEARYNLAFCRFEYARTLSSPSKKKEALLQAERDVLIIERLFPDMGGDEWFPKYNELYKKIQKLLGKSATGLKKPAAAVKPKTDATKSKNGSK